MPGVGVRVRAGGRLTPCAAVAWPAVGFIRPVLKHGPRSAAGARVFGWLKTPGCAVKVKARLEARRGGSRSPERRTVDRSDATPWRDSSESVAVATRKMVNYARAGRSQRKLWWKPAAVLTCKSIVKLGYRGERLIEPSSSWFPPKFPSG